MQALNKLSIAALIMVFFFVWPCYALGYDTYYSRGLAYNQIGQYEKAISDYTKAIDLKPKHADTYYSRGLAYNQMGHY